MNTAQRVITRFGGQTALAEAVHTKQSTIHYWSRIGSIPAKWHKAILEAAIRRGISVGPSDLVSAPELPGKHILSTIPEAKWPGVLAVADDELPVYVLEDGRRVITRTGSLNFLTGGKGGGNLESYLRIKALDAFLPRDLDDQFIDITIPQVVNKNVQAMSASAFIDICRAYSRARDTGALTSDSQVAMAVRASMLLAAFAKTGIEAAIDEATGYQYERASDALRTKLRLFLEEEMRPWEKTFPDELWIQFGRLTRWKGPIHERPKYWGKLVMELVYSYLDPDVAEWLKTHAPEPRHGRNYHQWLSGQYGLRKLTEHIWMLVGLASACSDMRELRQRMAEKFGREGVQFTLYLPPGRPAAALPKLDPSSEY
jgi:P63C domain